jgi:sigma-B regulation protein RsbU (phosphoserine phosphatase)
MDAARTSRLARTTSRTRVPSSTAGQRGRVWIVDDSKLEIERASRLLSGAHEIESFLEGTLMVERLAAGPAPDVVLLDWQMPGLSGLELCRFLREQYDEVTLPILMLTARGAREDFAEGLAAGANDYVAKPYDDAELRARVATLVRVRRQADETRESEAWLRTILASVGEGVVATNADGRVVFLNPVAEALTGVTQEAALGASVDDVFPFLAQPVGPAVLHRDGHPVRIEHSASPIRAPNGTPDGTPGGASVDTAAAAAAAAVVGTVYVLRDVTARMQHELDERARADFEEKLIGIVSHDLRNPLQAILLGARALLGREEIDARTATSVLRIQRSADRATRLVSDVLDFTQARVGSGIPMHRQRVNLHDVAAQVVDEIQAAHPQSEIVHEARGAAVGSFDPDRVAQVVVNLLSNALKYGAEARPVLLRTRGEEGFVVIEVANEGAAIDDNIVRHMFEPMRRGVDGDRASRSVGLGLYIVKHIVDAHGGSIACRSRANEGTTFTVRLPR